jgi:hypothetical protein
VSHSARLASPRGSGVKSDEKIQQILLRFKADARELRRGPETLSNDCIIAITTEGLEAERVNFGAAESESGYDMQAKEMAAMRPESRALPAQIGARRGATMAAE